jgi:hypothetical protein
MFVPHRKHTCDPARPITWIALLYYMYMMLVRNRKHTSGAPQPAAGVAVLYYMEMFVPHRKHTCAPARSVTGTALLLFFFLVQICHLSNTALLYRLSSLLMKSSSNFLYSLVIFIRMAPCSAYKSILSHSHLHIFAALNV